MVFNGEGCATIYIFYNTYTESVRKGRNQNNTTKAGIKITQLQRIYAAFEFQILPWMIAFTGSARIVEGVNANSVRLTCTSQPMESSTAKLEI